MAYYGEVQRDWAGSDANHQYYEGYAYDGGPHRSPQGYAYDANAGGLFQSEGSAHYGHSASNPYPMSQDRSLSPSCRMPPAGPTYSGGLGSRWEGNESNLLSGRSLTHERRGAHEEMQDGTAAMGFQSWNASYGHADASPMGHTRSGDRTFGMPFMPAGPTYSGSLGTTWESSPEAHLHSGRSLSHNRRAHEEIHGYDVAPRRSPMPVYDMNDGFSPLSLEGSGSGHYGNGYPMSQSRSGEPYSGSLGSRWEGNEANLPSGRSLSHNGRVQEVSQVSDRTEGTEANLLSNRSLSHNGRTHEEIQVGQMPSHRRPKGGPAGRTSMQTMYSFHAALDDDPEMARIRGLVFIIIMLVCWILWLVGLLTPLARVVVFPDSDYEFDVDKTLVALIKDQWDKRKFFHAVAIGITSVIVPGLMFFGQSILIFDNFFAKGFDYVADYLGRQGLLTANIRSLIVDFMVTICVYEVVSSFLGILVICFFTGSFAVVHVRAGFYAYSLYCLLSIFMLQSMAALKEPPEDEEEDTMHTAPSGARKSIAGLRRKLSGWTQANLPELPGFEGRKVANVDTLQVLLLTLIFFVCAAGSLKQPLLDLHITVEGLTFARKELTLVDVLDIAWHKENVLIFVGFMLSFFVIPALYSLSLLTAGILNLQCWRNCCGDPGRAYDFFVWLALLLRPWAMTDVFGIALGLFVFSAQDECLVTTIPDGVVYLPGMRHGIRWHFFSGIYLIVGAGMAVFCLRWFWQSGVVTITPGEEVDDTYAQIQGVSRDTYANYANMQGVSCELSPRPHSREESRDDWPDRQRHRASTWDVAPDGDGPEESRLKIISRWKALWCVFWWIAACTAISYLPFPLLPFRLSHTNEVLNATLPVMNNMIVKSLPASLGSCHSTDFVPQPCREKGPLYHAMDDGKKISIPWVTGLNTLSITKLSVNKEVRRIGKQERSQYKIGVTGAFKHLHLYLHVEMCDDNNGNGCKLLVATNNSCCQDDRNFHIEVTMHCDENGAFLSVSKFELDPLLIDTSASLDGLLTDSSQHLTISLPKKDITGKVKAAVRAQISDFLTKKELIKWDGKGVNFQQLLGRVVKFSANDDLFKC